jgi:hypothetical protein
MEGTRGPGGRADTHVLDGQQGRLRRALPDYIHRWPDAAP